MSETSADTSLESRDQQKALKTELIRANLETAASFAKLALQSDSELETLRYRQKACDAYEEALHLFKTADLTHIELESIKTKMAHLDAVLMESDESS